MHVRANGGSIWPDTPVGQYPKVSVDYTHSVPGHSTLLAFTQKNNFACSYNHMGPAAMTATSAALCELHALEELYL